MQRTEYLGVDSDHRLQPVHLTRGILDVVARIPFPYRILKGGSHDVDLIVCKGIAETDIQTVGAMLVFQEILINTDLEVWG